MYIVRAVWWTLVTGHDRDMRPTLAWWRGPAWIRWTVLLGVMGWWGINTFLAWLPPVNGNSVFAGLIVALQISAPLLSRHRPLTALRIVFLATLVAMIVAEPIPRPVGLVHSWPLDMYLVPFAPVVASAIARSRTGDRIGIAVTTLVLVWGGGIWLELVHGSSVMAGPSIGVVVTVVVGYVLGDARQAKQESGEEREKRAHLQERNRIARELHDVIGHHLSMIAVRTDSAPYRLAGIDDAAKEEFAALGSAAREALDETRRLLGVLRDEDSEAEHVPQPTMGDIAELVEQTRRSGADVRLTVDGSTAGVPVLLGLSAYRIVQESLSNALQHSPGTSVEVRMLIGEQEIDLSVDNGPSTGPAGPEGNGLTGIRERVALVGGACTAGRRADGGFRVWARLPR